jgi:hypothetical protein
LECYTSTGVVRGRRVYRTWKRAPPSLSPPLSPVLTQIGEGTLGLSDLSCPPLVLSLWRWCPIGLAGACFGDDRCRWLTLLRASCCGGIAGRQLCLWIAAGPPEVLLGDAGGVAADGEAAGEFGDELGVGGALE